MSQRSEKFWVWRWLTIIEFFSHSSDPLPHWRILYELIGEALETDRVKVLESNQPVSPYPADYTMNYEWVRAGIIPQFSHSSSSRISSYGAEDFLEQVFRSDGFGGALKVIVQGWHCQLNFPYLKLSTKFPSIAFEGNSKRSPIIV